MPTHFRFDPGPHKYYRNDVEIPGVTTILKDMGLYCVPRQATPYHRERGRILHEGCGLICRGEWDPDGTSPELVPPLRSFELWQQTTGFVTERIECSVYSDRMGFGGTLDLWGRLPDLTTVLIDCKGGAYEPHYDMQVALYGYALEEMTGDRTDQYLVLQLQETGRPKVHVVTDPAAALRRGLAAVDLWKWRQQHVRGNGRV